MSEGLTHADETMKDPSVTKTFGTAWTWFPGSTAGDYRRAVEERTTRPDGSFWSNRENLAVYRRQLRAKVRHLRHTLRPTGEWR